MAHDPLMLGTWCYGIQFLVGQCPPLGSHNDDRRHHHHRQSWRGVVVQRGIA